MVYNYVASLIKITWSIIWLRNDDIVVLAS